MNHCSFFSYSQCPVFFFKARSFQIRLLLGCKVSFSNVISDLCFWVRGCEIKHSRKESKKTKLKGAELWSVKINICHDWKQNSTWALFWHFLQGVLCASTQRDHQKYKLECTSHVNTHHSLIPHPLCYSKITPRGNTLARSWNCYQYKTIANKSLTLDGRWKWKRIHLSVESRTFAWPYLQEEMFCQTILQLSTVTTCNALMTCRGS